MGEKKHKKIKITSEEWNDYQILKAEREERLLEDNYQLVLEQQMQQIPHTITFTNQKFAYLPKLCQSCGRIFWLENYIVEQVWDRDILRSYISRMNHYGGIMNDCKKVHCLDCWLEKNNI